MTATVDVVLALLGARCLLTGGRSFSAGRTPDRARLRRLLAVVGTWAEPLAWVRRRDHDGVLVQQSLLAPTVWPVTLTAGGPLEMCGLRAGLMVGALVVVAIALVGGGALGVAAFVVVIIAPRWPDLTLARACRRVDGEIAAALPACLELVAAGLSTGNSTPLALVGASKAAGPTLNRLLGRAGALAELGAVPERALQQVSRASGVSELGEAAEAILRSRRLGVDPTPAVRAIADSAAFALRDRCQARSGRTGPIAVLVTAMVIAPACVAALIVLVLGGILIGGGPFAGGSSP